MAGEGGAQAVDGRARWHWILTRALYFGRSFALSSYIQIDTSHRHDMSAPSIAGWLPEAKRKANAWVQREW